MKRIKKTHLLSEKEFKEKMKLIVAKHNDSIDFHDKEIARKKRANRRLLDALVFYLDCILITSFSGFGVFWFLQSYRPKTFFTNLWISYVLSGLFLLFLIILVEIAMAGIKRKEEEEVDGNSIKSVN